jgi:hypothetical protein
LVELGLEPVLQVSGQPMAQDNISGDLHRLGRWEKSLGRQAKEKSDLRQSFRTAIEIARKQQAKSWELRSTTSLARLLRDTSRRDEARYKARRHLRLVHRGF